MSNRILLTAGGLQVSKPGYDVTTTGQVGMSFDSGYGMGLQVLISGSASVASQTSVSVSYGQTFAAAPLAFLQLKVGSTNYSGGFRYNVYNSLGNNIFTDSYSNGTIGYIFTDHLLLTNYNAKTATVYYCVMTAQTS